MGSILIRGAKLADPEKICCERLDLLKIYRTQRIRPWTLRASPCCQALWTCTFI